VTTRAENVDDRHVQCVDYVEFMLEQQLVAAVGKVLTAKDFAAYMAV
jgi:hypothetical protein